MALNPRQLSAMLQGVRGDPQMRFKLYRSDIAGNEIEEYQGAENVSISMNNSRENCWELTLDSLEDPNYHLYKDFIKVKVEVKAPIDKNWEVFPMGLYKFTSPQANHDDTTVWTLTGRSLEYLALRSYAGPYATPAGRGVLQEARLILMTLGVPANRINFPNRDVKLKTTQFFDPFQDASACYKLNIINTLLNAGGFYSLYTDAEGRFTTKRIEDLLTAEPDVFYTTEDDLFVVSKGQRIYGERMVTTASIPDEYNDENFANQVYVFSTDGESEQQFVGRAENHDPSSPFSIENYGQIVAAEPITYDSIISQEEADLLALAALQRATGFYRRVEVQVPVDPRRGLQETAMLEIVLQDKNLAVAGKWRNLGWQLDDEGMTLEYAKLEGDYQEVQRIREDLYGGVATYRSGTPPRTWATRTL